MAWERLAHVALSGAGDSLASGTFTAKKSIRVIVTIIASGDVEPRFRFNGDSGSNYSYRKSSNGGSDGTSTSITYADTYGGNAGNTYIVSEITNISAQEKLMITHTMGTTAGAGNVPDRREYVQKWANTSAQITSIEVINGGSGDFATGSYITVLGAKEPVTADVISVDCGTDATATTPSLTSPTSWLATNNSSSDKITLDTTAGEVDYIGTRDGNWNSLTYNLGSVLSNTEWVVRARINITSLTAGNQAWFIMGMSKVPSSTDISGEDSGSITDSCLGYIMYESTNKRFGLAGGNDRKAVVNNMGYDTLGFTPSTDTYYYVELKRTSDANATFTIYDDSTFTTVKQTKTNTGNLAGASDLQYLGFYNMKDVATGGAFVVEVDQIKIYDGVTAVTSGKKHLMVQVKGIGTGGTINCNLTFNSDTGNNYSIRESVNGGADSTNVSQANTDNITGTVTGNVFATVHILNEASKEKLFISDGLESASGAGNSPERKEMVGKWANTSAQITTIKANNGGTGSFAEGTEVTVYGTD